MPAHERTSSGILQALRLSTNLTAPTASADGQLGAIACGTHPIILVVDDEEPMREIMHEILRSEGYIVLCADHADLAKRIASFDIGIDLLITDVWMPGTNGMELAAWFQQRFPQTRRLHVSGDPKWLQERRNDPPPHHFLAKPFKAGDFLSKIKEILAEEWAAGA